MILKFKNNNCDIQKIINDLKTENIRIERNDLNETTHGFLTADNNTITLYLYETDDLDFLCIALSPIEYYIPKIKAIMENNGATPL